LYQEDEHNPNLKQSAAIQIPHNMDNEKVANLATALLLNCSLENLFTVSSLYQLLNHLRIFNVQRASLYMSKGVMEQ
jgi:hypothetical protein